MAYLNNIYGNAAYCGFIKGNLTGRKSTSTTATDYLTLKTAALAFAAQVDSLIVFDALVSTNAGITQLAITTNTIAANEQWRAGILKDICAAQMSGAFSFDATQADYTKDAAAVFAIWTEMILGLTTP